MTEIFSLQETQRPIHQHFFVTWVLPNLISLIVFGIAYLVEKNLQNLRSLVIILKFLFHVLSVELKLKNSHEFRCFIVASLLIVAIYIYISIYNYYYILLYIYIYNYYYILLYIYIYI